MNSTNVVIRDSIVGPCAGTGVRVRGSSGVKIEGSEFRDTDGGIYALASESVSVSDNTFRGTGRNPIQFDKVRGSGNAVVSNIIQNEPGNPLTEDSINIYMSGGTPESPLVVANNLIRGGGSSSSGSGIMVGDNGGSFTEVVENLLIEPGQVGIGVAGGHDITVRDNVVYSAARQWTNVGIYVWDQYDSDCSGIEVRGNLVEFYSSSGDPNRYFDGGNCGPIDGWEANEEAVGLLGRLDQIEMDLIGAS